MSGNNTFLRAEWKNLLLFNYKVDPLVLEPFLPPDCELDYYERAPYLSLVAFQFLDTHVFGRRWPGLTNFPEVNLRFYIRHKGQRGVCFIREFVPSPIVTGVAKLLYNEPYKTARIKDRVMREPGMIQAEYELKSGNGFMRMFVQADSSSILPEEGSEEHFFKEHELGVGVSRFGKKPITYKVDHPFWRVYPVRSYDVRVEADKLYGEHFHFLNSAQPDSVLFAHGSRIKVSKKM